MKIGNLSSLMTESCKENSPLKRTFDRLWNIQIKVLCLNSKSLLCWKVNLWPLVHPKLFQLQSQLILNPPQHHNEDSDLNFN